MRESYLMTSLIVTVTLGVGVAGHADLDRVGVAGQDDLERAETRQLSRDDLRQLTFLQKYRQDLHHTRQDLHSAKRNYRQEDLSDTCVTRSACVVEGNNLIKSMKTDAPIRLPGSASTRESCQEMCSGTNGCRYFTWYDKEGAFPFSCYLYTSCTREEQDCQHCFSGPGVCKTAEETSCKAIDDDFGGTWYCFPEVDLESPVPHDTKCIWQCPAQSSYHECHNGKWEVEPGHSRCMCHKIGTEHEGEVLCFPPNDLESAVHSGTYCIHTCHGHPKHEMTCDHSLWSFDPQNLSCEADPNLNLTTNEIVRTNIGTLAHTRKLASLGNDDANLKHIMKTKVDGQIVTMRKVVKNPPSRQNAIDVQVVNGQIINRPKAPQGRQQPSKVLDIITANNPTQINFDQFSTADLNLINRPTQTQFVNQAQRHNPQPLKLVQNNPQAQRLVQNNPQGQRLVQNNPQFQGLVQNNPQAQRLVQNNPDAQRLLQNQRPQSTRIVFEPSPEEFPNLFKFNPAEFKQQLKDLGFERKQSDGANLNSIFQQSINELSGQHRSQLNSIATYPQTSTDLPSITATTSTFGGFHQILPPNLGPNPEPRGRPQVPISTSADNLREHVVTSQLQVGRPQTLQQEQQNRQQTPATPLNVLQQQRKQQLELELKKLLKQQQQLERSQSIREQDIKITTTERNSFTAEMLQNALKLVHLNQKKSVGTPNFNLLRQSKEIQSNVHSKDNAPILLPPPGDHMIPMSEDTLVKQNKLRSLRTEMIEMKTKLAEIEARGEKATREHVKAHLNKIKAITTVIKPLQRVPSDAHPIEIMTAPPPEKHTSKPYRPTKWVVPNTKNSGLWTQTNKLKNNLMTKTKGSVKPPKFRPYNATHVAQVMNPEAIKKANIQSSRVVQVPARLRVTLPRPHEQKQKQKQELDEVGDVIDGLAEMANKFPEDFLQLMKALDGGGQSNNGANDMIDGANIANLAALINQASPGNLPSEVRNTRLSTSNKSPVHCVKPVNPPHGKLLCNKHELVQGVDCLLQCQYGYVAKGPELTTCQKGGRWSNKVLGCERPIAMLIGGYNVEDGLLSDVELFSTTGKCRNFKVAPLPSPRRGLVAAWVGGGVLACGGHNDTKELNQCWTYKPNSNSWVETSGLNMERHFGSVVSASGSLVVVGGRDGSPHPMAMGNIEQYDAQEQKWNNVQTRLSMERSYQCAVGLTRDSLLVTGGYSWNSILSRTESLSMSQGSKAKWKALANLNTPRYLHGCAMVQLPPSKNNPQPELGVIVAGGYSDSYLNSTEIYYPSSDKWRYAGSLSTARQGAAVTVLDGKPTIIGGFYDFDQYPVLAEQFDPEMGFWFPLKKKLRTARRYFAIALVPESLFPRC